MDNLVLFLRVFLFCREHLEDNYFPFRSIFYEYEYEYLYRSELLVLAYWKPEQLF